MKKLSLLVALVLLVTVGGVYATWNYAQGNVQQSQEFILPQMATEVLSGSKGTISVDVSNITMTVDDLEDGTAHNAKLVFNDGGTVAITFNPSVGADEDVIANGIKMRATVTVTDNWQYDSKNIFTVDTSKNVFATTGAATSLTITAQQLADAVKLNDFTLDTYNDFLSFEAALNRGNIKITVEEVQ
ncbi:MAG: hypothetical protein IKA63_06845 [Clostridia bacterium]|nr:hypothetical protein [Clostridia bacterium]